MALWLGLAGVGAMATAGTVEWPEFRGPRGDGHVNAAGDSKPAGFPVRWSETENIRWKTAIPYRGLSTPVVGEGRVWVTTATEDGHDYFVLGLDAATGKVLVNEKLFHHDNPESLGNGAGMNSYATPSSALEPGRVYVHFGSFGTACLDAATGQVRWRREDLPCRHYRGPASSVVLFEDLLILTMDGVDQQYVAALDKRTGQTVWRTNRSVAWNDENVPGQMARDGDLRKAHSTPFIAKVGGAPQMFSVGAKAAYAYEPRTGRELWRVEYPDWSAAPRPVFDQGLVFMVTGLTKRELWAIRPGGSGDVTASHLAWKLTTHVGKYASPIIVDGLMYTAAEESFITCLEAATGKVVWTERVGGKFAASPIFADGRLYFCDEEGGALVVKPGRSLDVVATNKLDAGMMASPAAAGRALYLRTKAHLYRVEDAAAAAR